MKTLDDMTGEELLAHFRSSGLTLEQRALLEELAAKAPALRRPDMDEAEFAAVVTLLGREVSKLRVSAQ